MKIFNETLIDMNDVSLQPDKQEHALYFKKKEVFFSLIVIQMQSVLSTLLLLITSSDNRWRTVPTVSK